MEHLLKSLNYLIEHEQKHYEEDPSDDHIYIHATKALEFLKETITLDSLNKFLDTEIKDAEIPEENSEEPEYDAGFIEAIQYLQTKIIIQRQIISTYTLMKDYILS